MMARVSRRPAYRESVDALAHAQKSGYGVPPYTRYVNRPVGRQIAAAAHVCGWTPNQLTAVSGALSAVGVVMVASMEPGWSVAIAATIALLLGYAFDSADGQLARLRGSGGPAGEWLDHVVDAARQPVIHVAALIYLYRFWDESSVWLLAPICFLVVTTARFLSQVLAEQLRRGSGQIGPAGGAGGERRAVLQLPADPGMLCLVFATAGNPLVFVWAYGMLAVVNIAIGLVSFRRRFAELGALEVEREGEASTPATPAEPVGPP